MSNQITSPLDSALLSPTDTCTTEISNDATTMWVAFDKICGAVVHCNLEKNKAAALLLLVCGLHPAVCLLGARQILRMNMMIQANVPRDGPSSLLENAMLERDRVNTELAARAAGAAGVSGTA